MNLTISNTDDKRRVFEKIQVAIEHEGFTIEASDNQRPWGGFFVIKEDDAPAFIQKFFPDVPATTVHISKRLSPKILLVAPGKRLSWQYHHRRAEIWKIISGDVLVAISETDEENPPETRNINDLIILNQGQRHRLIGKEGWGIIAEIWQHTDELQPSDESDIVRVQDDFGR